MPKSNAAGLAGLALLLMVSAAGCNRSGALQVNLSPPAAIDAGAQWAVDDAAWQNSGATVSKLSIGTHTVTFRNVAGWTAPENLDTSIVKNETRVISAEYLQIHEGEGEGEGEAVFEGEGEVVTEGEGEAASEGEGEIIAEGEGEVVPEGEGETIAEGEGEVVTEGEGEVVTEGEGEIIAEGEGEGEIVSEGEGEGKAEVFVDATNDTGLEDGSEAYPFNTILEAVHAGAAGAMLRVSPGLYHERVTLKAGMTLLGNRGAYHTRLLDSELPVGPLLTLSEGCTVRGFIFTGTADTGVSILPGASATVSNCVVTGFDLGIVADTGASCAVVNTTVYGNGVGVRGESGVTFGEWKNNIISSNQTGVSSDSDALSGDGFNNYFANGQDLSGPAPLPSDISVEPEFVSPGQDNFHLSANSPCRNAGSPEEAYLDLDGSRNDLGSDGGPGGVRDTMAPHAVIAVTPDSGPSPLIVTMDGSASEDEWGIASYLWDLDIRDGLQADLSGPNVQYLYPDSNEYMITLTVTDNSGFSALATASVKVNPARLPIASASRVPIAGPAPLLVEFQAEGSNPDGGEVQFSWDFGDLHTSTEQNPSHVYENVPPGAYKAVLTVTNIVGATAVVTVPITITENAVLASDTITPDTGGTIVVVGHPESPLNGAFVEIPPGAVSEPIALAICGTEISPPEPRGRVGTVHGMVEIGPTGVRLSQPARVLVPVPAPIDPLRQVGAVHYYSELDAWTSDDIPNIVYESEPSPAISFETTHFSFFAVGTLWTITGLGTLGGAKSYAFGMNDSGQVVGYSYVFVSTNWRWAYVWDAVTGMTALGTLGGKHSYAFAINEGGTVVGCNQVTDAWLGERHAFIWDPVNSMRDLGNLGGNSTVAQDINASGTVVGYGLDAAGKYQAFICQWDGDEFVMTALPTLGGNQGYAYGINESGKVVGTAQVASGAWHAFVWDLEGGIRDIGVLGSGNQCTARDINDLDEVVGESNTGNGAEARAFLWTSSSGIQALGTLGGESSVATGINHDGYIVGTAQTASGEWHGYVWDGSQMDDLNDLLPPDSGWIVGNVYGINRSGDIIGRDSSQAFLMRR